MSDKMSNKSFFSAPQHAVHGHPLHIPPPTGPPHGSTHFHQPDQFAQQGAWPSGPTLSLGHKKLQRQLTINPNFDPRIHQVWPLPPFNAPYFFLVKMPPF